MPRNRNGWRAGAEPNPQSGTSCPKKKRKCGSLRLRGLGSAHAVSGSQQGETRNDWLLSTVPPSNQPRIPVFPSPG